MAVRVSARRSSSARLSDDLVGRATVTYAAGLTKLDALTSAEPAAGRPRVRTRG